MRGREADKHHKPPLLFHMSVPMPPQNDILDVDNLGRRRSTEEEEADVTSIFGPQEPHQDLSLLCGIFTETTQFRSVLILQRSVPVAWCDVVAASLPLDLWFKQAGK